jgi:tetratricopeptide (TPR) repeat protein
VVLGEVGDGSVVEALIEALRDEDRLVREEAEASCWAIWSRSGDPELDELLSQGSSAMEEGRLEEALATFDDLIARAPSFAEAYNQRAIVHYLTGAYARSIQDCERALGLNPLHFGALNGAGLCYLKLAFISRALDYFKRALEINPNLTETRRLLVLLKTVGENGDLKPS